MSHANSKLQFPYFRLHHLDCLNGTGSSACAMCTGLPANATFDSGYTGQTSNSCPWTCLPGFYPALLGPAGGHACLACSNAPAHTSYSGPGTLLGVCPWQCIAGYMQASAPAEGCVSCPVGMYSSASGEFNFLDFTAICRIQKITRRSLSKELINLEHMIRRTFDCCMQCLISLDIT